jgi:hypothetical protein
MSRINLEKLNETQCRELIQKFLEEGKTLLEKGKYDESAKHLFMAAKVIQHLPTIKRKELRRDKVNKSIKNQRNMKPQFNGDVQEPPSPSSPFEGNEDK